MKKKIFYLKLQFPVFDASNDGKINFDEFLAQLLNVSNAKLIKEETERKIVQAQVKLYSSYFNLWDKDSNGKLDKEEFGKLLTLRKIPKEHIDIVFQCFDFNKDLVINFDEFFKILLAQKQKKRLSTERKEKMIQNDI